MQHTFMLVAKDTTDSGMGIISIDRQNDTVLCAEYDAERQHVAKRVRIREHRTSGQAYITRCRVGMAERHYFMAEFKKPQRGQIYGGKEH